MSGILLLPCLAVLVLGLCACAPAQAPTAARDQDAAQEQSSAAPNTGTALDLAAIAEKEVSAADWVKPLADTVMAVICSGGPDGDLKTACAAYEAASAAVGAQVFLTREVLKKYKGDPTPINATELKDVIEDLKTKMLPVLKGYQGQL